MKHEVLYANVLRLLRVSPSLLPFEQVKRWKKAARTLRINPTKVNLARIAVALFEARYE